MPVACDRCLQYMRDNLSTALKLKEINDHLKTIKQNIVALKLENLLLRHLAGLPDDAPVPGAPAPDDPEP